MRVRLVCAASLVLLAACANDLDRISLVKTPRVLAMVADPPEAAPGEDVSVRVLAFDPAGRELHYAFRACVDPASFFGSFTPDEGNSDTHAMAFCTDLPGNGNSTVVPGIYTQMLYDQLATFAPAAGLTADTLDQLVGSVGIPLQVRVRVTAVDPMTGAETATLITAVKTFGLTSRATRTTNPPFVYFSIGDSLFLGGVDRSSFECTLWAGSPPPVFHASPPQGHGDPVSAFLLPHDDPNTWEETYPYIDYSRMVRLGREGAYYSWFTTSDVSAPCLHSDCHTIREGDETTSVSSTADPHDPFALLNRAAEWDLPSTPGTYHFWLVVRDGHLGEAACHTTIEVVP